MEELELKIVDFEIAKKLKELGFPQDYNEPIYAVKDCKREDGDYWEKVKEGDYFFDAGGFCRGEWINAPTLELVKKWLMDTKNLYIDITPNFWLNEEKTEFKFKKFEIRIIDLTDEDIKETVKKLSEKKKDREYFEKYDDAPEWGVKNCLTKLEKI